MKKTLFLILIICPFVSFAQQIVFDRLNLSINSNLDKADKEYVDSVFNQSAFSISLVKLLPRCKNSGNCYNESLIKEDYNWNTPVSDSTFGDQYFKGVFYQYIDSSSIVEIDTSDYSFFLKELVNGKRKTYKNEIVDMCYNPRHAVLYLNNNGEIIAVHEICFECGHTKSALFTTEMRHNSSSSFRKMFIKYGLF